VVYFNALSLMFRYLCYSRFTQSFRLQ